MFEADFKTVCSAGVAKNQFRKKNPAGYMVSSMVAGMFISFGSFVSFILGSFIAASDFAPWTKAVQGFAFASALSLVVMAGAELFTGNNLVMAAASFRKEVSWKDTGILWFVCWLGNLAGSALMVAAITVSGVINDDMAAYFTQIAAAKTGIAPVPLIVRAILCNIMVCLGVWCGLKMKSESGKLIMIFWCIFIFMICGFEHSVANMSILGVSVANGTLGIGKYMYSILLATVGNIIGGACFVALPYHVISKEQDR